MNNLKGILACTLAVCCGLTAVNFYVNGTAAPIFAILAVYGGLGAFVGWVIAATRGTYSVIVGSITLLVLWLLFALVVMIVGHRSPPLIVFVTTAAVMAAVGAFGGFGFKLATRVRA